MRKQLLKEKHHHNKSLQPHEIAVNSKPALDILDMAFKEIEDVERVGGARQKLTTIQKNRMAISFLEMNDKPKKYSYYKRFMEEGKVSSNEKAKNNSDNQL